MARMDLKENEYMERFVGQDHVDSNDNQFWYQLLSCSFNFMRVQNAKLVEKTLDPYIVRLTLNNSQSFNIGSLVRVFLDRASRVKSKSGQSANPYYVYQSFNALYLLRSICKSYIENSSEDQLIKSFRSIVDVTPKQPAVTIQQQQQNVPLPPHLIQSQGNIGTSDPINESSNIHTPPPTINQSNGISQQQSNQPEPMVQQPNSLPSSLSTETPKSSQDEPVNKKTEFTSGATMLDQFISALISILVDIPVVDSTYFLQVEAINSLLVLLSIQMYSATPANQSVIYKSLMQKKASIHALILTKTLLNNFVNQHPMPNDYGGSIIIGLASGLWRVLTLGYGGGREEDDTDCMPVLAKHSLLLLNVLTNHYTSDKNPYREAIVSCQDSRYNLSDPTMAIDNANNDALATATTSMDALTSNSIKIDFGDLYKTICKYLHDNQVALLLYLLLHSNKIFRSYILTTASSELDLLVLPLLKILYSSIDKKGSHHVYMVLIIFIIMTEETAFNEALHRIQIRNVPWYAERILGEISLGSLTTLIIIRSFQFNTFRMKDRFLHTNLFATLANLSNYFIDLHPYVCQRLVDLLDRLCKKYLLATKGSTQDQHHPQQQQQQQQKQTPEILHSDNALARALATDTQKQDIQDASSFELDSTAAAATAASQSFQVAINLNSPEQQVLQSQQSNNMVLPPLDTTQMSQYPVSLDSSSGQQSPGSDSTSGHVNISMDETKQDISLIEEVIRMILEVINNSLATQLSGNTNLIYTLLYKRNVFTSLLSSHQSFYNMVITIERTLTFFYNKVEAADRQLTVDEIKHLIQSSSKEWNFVDQTRDPNARLKFLYMEHEQPEEFFIPYIWTHIFYSSGIVWNSKRILLFNPDEV